MSDYDVIVIGSGAGGGTLVRRLAPSGKRILLLERGDWLPREPANWDAHSVFVDNRYVSEDTWYDARGQAVPAADPLLRRRRDQALRRRALPPARRGLRRAGAPRRHLPRLADRLRRDGAVLHARRAALPGPRRARGRPDRAAGERALPVPGRQPRAAHPAAVRRPRGRRPPPVPRALRRHARRGEHALRPLRALRHLRRLPLPRAREVRRRRARRPPGARAPERHAAHERRGAAPRDQREGHGRHRRRGRPRRRPRDLRGRHRRRLLRRGEQRQAAARVGERRPPRRPRQRLGPARAQLHVPQQPGRARALEGAEPDRLPEDARAQRLLLRAATTSSSRSATSRWSASPRREMYRGEKPIQTKLAPERTLARSRAATPSTSGSRRRTCRGRRTA